MNATIWYLPAANRRAALGAAAILAMLGLGATTARAEFFNDVKRTFQTDVPHFFQDDIPCAFGGQPTSGAKSSCRGNPARSSDPSRTPLRGEAAPTGATQSNSLQAPPPATQPGYVQQKPIPY